MALLRSWSEEESWGWKFSEEWVQHVATRRRGLQPGNWGRTFWRSCYSNVCQEWFRSSWSWPGARGWARWPEPFFFDSASGRREKKNTLIYHFPCGFSLPLPSQYPLVPGNKTFIYPNALSEAYCHALYQKFVIYMTLTGPWACAVVKLSSSSRKKSPPGLACNSMILVFILLAVC